MVNGEGVRTTLFVSGCEHACRGCYNQATWNPDNGIPFTRETLDEIIKSLEPDYVTGLTLTGGDPFFKGNITWVCRILMEVRKHFGDTKDIWVWSGYTLEEILSGCMEDLNMAWRWELLSFIDVFIDGKFIQELHDPTLAWRGSSNQTIHRLKRFHDESICYNLG